MPFQHPPQAGSQRACNDSSVLCFLVTGCLGTTTHEDRPIYSQGFEQVKFCLAKILKNLQQFQDRNLSTSETSLHSSQASQGGRLGQLHARFKQQLCHSFICWETFLCLLRPFSFSSVSSIFCAPELPNLPAFISLSRKFLLLQDNLFWNLHIQVPLGGILDHLAHLDYACNHYPQSDRLHKEKTDSGISSSQGHQESDPHDR